jgi:hypothetical protein
MFILALVACGAGSKDAPLDGALVRKGRIVLSSGCFKSVDAKTEVVDGQIVVTRLRGRNEEFGDCANTVRLAQGAGPDVVYPKQKVRLAFVGDEYRQIDYCGLATKRCVPFSPVPVPADCTQQSLRFATIGVFAGVYPIEILRCEQPWATVAIDTCGGYHDEDARTCTGKPRRVLLNIDAFGRWRQLGIDYKQLCPNAAESTGIAGVPKWVCKV